MLFNVVFMIICNFLMLQALPKDSAKSENINKKCGYEGCPVMKPDMLNVHIVAHTHDDVGWLKTVDQYYYGSKNTIQKAGVQYIIDNVVRALVKNPERRFIYVESAFFSKWWYLQNDNMKEQVKKLVNEGRLSFAGGAWSMNDEAIAHYHSIVDQFTWGLRFLNDTFGDCGRPTIGWQIDPFGHSNAQAALFAKMGYDGIFFSRLDYQDKIKRMVEKRMEMVWQSSKNLDDTDILAGALYQQWYNAPNGFCFDIVWCIDDPVIGDKRSQEYNADRRVNEFASVLQDYAKTYRSNNVMLTMGGDFTFQIAEGYFKNLDNLIKYTNERQSELKINAFYSTPACYTKALHDTNDQWPTKSDDFFPYASDPHSYWSGYYTSRATLKRFERIGNHFLQICKQLSSTATVEEEFYENHLSRLRGIMGVMQHHDAVTGTEKQHVTDDYSRELHASIVGCSINTKSSLNQLITSEEPTTMNTDWPFNFTSCLQLNISICDVSEYSEKILVTVYNPLAHNTSQYARFPVSGDSYEVRDSSNNLVTHQILPIPKSVENLHYRTNNASRELLFYANAVPALGYSSFFVTRLISSSSGSSEIKSERSLGEIFTIGSDDFQVTFDANGLLSEVSVDGVINPLWQNFIYYTGANMNNQIFANRSSGAYIFRPSPGTTETIIDVTQLEVYYGDHVDEVHQTFNEWVSQVVRLYKTEKYIELEWLVGPIDIEDGDGKEIVSRFSSNINSESIFYTDSNGRDMLRRKRDARETWDIDMEEKISGNYYPITTRIAIEDDSYRLAVLTDRAEGGSSMIDGTVELMVHRRLMRDDTFGVDEALNETAYGQGLVVRGKHWLHFGNKMTQGPTVKARERLLQNQILMPVWLFFDDVTTMTLNTWLNTYNNTHTAIKMELPSNIFLMTFEPWKDKSFLIRFEHIMEKDEDPLLSLPVSFNISNVFPGEYKFAEVSLAGNQWIEDVTRLHFIPEGTLMQTHNITIKESRRNRWLSDSDVIITLNPMEIRTFVMSSLIDEGNSGGFKSQTIFGYFIFIITASVMRNYLVF